MKTMMLAAAMVGALATAPAFAAPTIDVDANTAGTAIGAVVKNRTYRVTATGTVDLVGDQIPGGSFNLNADGVPQPAVTNPDYIYFNPFGSPVADGQSGPLPGANFGALIGNYGGASGYFLLGSDRTFVAAQTGTLFGRINDINFNNSGSFQVTLASVPEPATWALMILGFGAIGGAMRRRAKVRTGVAFA